MQKYFSIRYDDCYLVAISKVLHKKYTFNFQTWTVNLCPTFDILSLQHLWNRQNFLMLTFFCLYVEQRGFQVDESFWGSDSEKVEPAVVTSRNSSR